MGVGGVVGLSTAANVFVGMVEAPLFVRPYLARVSRGELFAIMVAGMASIAGTVLFLYASILGPVLLVVLADLRNLATVDRDLGRYTMAGGASIYPFVWSILLAAYAEGLGGVMTTMVIPSEPEAKEMLGVPDELVIAAVVALGEPVNRPRKLTRAPVSSFTFVDRFGGEPFGAG